MKLLRKVSIQKQSFKVVFYTIKDIILFINKVYQNKSKI